MAEEGAWGKGQRGQPGGGVFRRSPVGIGAGEGSVQVRPRALAEGDEAAREMRPGRRGRLKEVLRHCRSQGHAGEVTRRLRNNRVLELTGESGTGD